MPPDPLVYRAPMRTRTSPGRGAVGRALAHGLVGVNGVLTTPPAELTSALAEVSETYGDRLAARIERFADAPDGSFVWTQDEAGETFLGQITGGWRYDNAPGATAIDLVHVRPCTWLPDPIEPRHIPAPVSATFARGGLNWQRIRHASSGPASAALWEDA